MVATTGLEARLAAVPHPGSAPWTAAARARLRRSARWSARGPRPAHGYGVDVDAPSDPRPGETTPDDRGRTGLDAVGRALDRNPDVVVRDVEVVSNGWHVLRRTTLDVRRRDGRWDRQQRETYDRGNGATVLPLDPDRGTVLLTRQFRWPAYVNGHPDGMLVEAAAGLLDEDDPDTAVRREAAEELGSDSAPSRRCSTRS